MLDITINLATGVAALARTTAIKAGGTIPARITFSESPGADPGIELALSPASGTPTVLAYLDEWRKQNNRVFLGSLNTNDERLIEHLAGLSTGTATLNVELVVTVAEVPRPFANFPVTVQRPVITGPQSSQSGPVYPFFLISASDDPSITMRVEVLSNKQFNVNVHSS
jgi:hypothetical protein